MPCTGSACTSEAGSGVSAPRHCACLQGLRGVGAFGEQVMAWPQRPIPPPHTFSKCTWNTPVVTDAAEGVSPCKGDLVVSEITPQNPSMQTTPQQRLPYQVEEGETDRGPPRHSLRGSPLGVWGICVWASSPTAASPHLEGGQGRAPPLSSSVTWGSGHGQEPSPPAMRTGGTQTSGHSLGRTILSCLT